MIEIKVTGATLEEIRDALNELYDKKETVTLAPAAAPTDAPTFTLAQVAKAGADLVSAHPDKIGELVSKLEAYGVQSVAQLKEDQLGSFVTELRAMGGAI